MILKTHSILYILITLAIIAAAVIAMTYFLGTKYPQENRGAVTAPTSEPHSNLNYFTANSDASQENTKNPASVTTEPRQSSSESSISPESEAKASSYTVKTFNGKIGVFADSEETPIDIIDVEIATLPQEDQATLTNGITAKDKSSLRRILEDYES